MQIDFRPVAEARPNTPVNNNWTLKKEYNELMNADYDLSMQELERLCYLEDRIARNEAGLPSEYRNNIGGRL